MERSLFTAGWKREEKRESSDGSLKLKSGETSHQVDVENRGVVAVHVHGALLRCQTDGAVFQGEGGVGLHVVSETDSCTLHSVAAQQRLLRVCRLGRANAQTTPAKWKLPAPVG